MKHLSYGVPTLAAYELMAPEIRDALPTAPDKAAKAAVYSDAFWVEKQAAATERFNVWVSK